MSRKDQSRWFGLIGFFSFLLQQLELQKQQQQQHLHVMYLCLPILFCLFAFAISWVPETSPITAVPVAIGDTHHNQEEDEAEEDEAWDDVDDGRGDRDGDWGLHLFSPFRSKWKRMKDKNVFQYHIRSAGRIWDTRTHRVLQKWLKADCWLLILSVIAADCW